jgi:hypothetical protein
MNWKHAPEQENQSQTERLMRALRSLPSRVPPPILGTSLRILASRELRRQKLSRWERCLERVGHVRFLAGDMMRPLALPLAGGVFSAIVLFSSVFLTTYPAPADVRRDVPTVLTTEASVKSAGPIGAAGDVIVDVTIDEQGRMVDYTIIGGAVLADVAYRRQLENMLLFTEFAPATAFGVPTVSRIRLSLSSASVEVRG